MKIVSNVIVYCKRQKNKRANKMLCNNQEHVIICCKEYKWAAVQNGKATKSEEELFRK